MSDKYEVVEDGDAFRSLDALIGLRDALRDRRQPVGAGSARGRSSRCPRSAAVVAIAARQQSRKQLGGVQRDRRAFGLRAPRHEPKHQVRRSFEDTSLKERALELVWAAWTSNPSKQADHHAGHEASSDARPTPRRRGGHHSSGCTERRRATHAGARRGNSKSSSFCPSSRSSTRGRDPHVVRRTCRSMGQ